MWPPGRTIPPVRPAGWTPPSPDCRIQSTPPVQMLRESRHAPLALSSSTTFFVHTVLTPDRRRRTEDGGRRSVYGSPSRGGSQGPQDVGCGNCILSSAERVLKGPLLG